MPQNDQVAVADNDWVELTNADATNVTFQVTQGAVSIQRGTSTKPTTFGASFSYTHGEGELNKPISEIFPGGTGSRLWARSHSGGSQVMVSHA